MSTKPLVLFTCIDVRARDIVVLRAKKGKLAIYFDKTLMLESRPLSRRPNEAEKNGFSRLRMVVVLTYN